MKSLFSMVVINFIWKYIHSEDPYIIHLFLFPTVMMARFFVVFGYFFFCVWIGVTLHSSSSSSLDLQIYPPHISGSESSEGIASQAFQTCFCVSASFAAVAFHPSLPGFPRLSAFWGCLWTHPVFFLASYASLWLPSFTLPFYNCLTPLSECSHQLSHKWLHEAQTVYFLIVFFALGNSECNLTPLYHTRPNRSLSQGLRLWF